VKGTLPNAVIRWSADRAEEFLGKVWSSPPSRPEELPQAAEAWVRRTGTALFPAGNEWRKQTSELEIISVGGESHEHQQERLLYLIREIQKQERRF
ncbi:MAG TPA: hypothetical protein VHM91_17425, partial [Verrucomicrobiales bacterium]|nr:hypothetical protein [Verrucomicrobiales bacterium]